MIYADYAATTGFHPQNVKKAVLECLDNPGNPGRGSHERAMSTSRKIYGARCAVAEFFDAPGPDRVAFSSGVTQSLNIAIKGILNPGDHVITTWAEHNSVLRPLYEMQEKGVELTVVAPSLEAIRETVRDNTSMVVMSGASNVTGDVFDIASVGHFCHDKGIIFVVDSAQRAGVVPISMKKEYIDVLCFAGHKGLLGMQGIGGMCVAENISIRPFVTGGSGIHSYDKRHPTEMPTALEAGTLNVPGIISVAEGIKFLEDIGMENVRYDIYMMYRYFHDSVAGIPGVVIYEDNEAGTLLRSETGEATGIKIDKTDCSKVHTATVALNIGRYDASEMAQLLEEEFGIGVRAGAHCAPLVHEHYGTREQGMVRFSFGIGTKYEEIDECIYALRQIAKEFSES